MAINAGVLLRTGLVAETDLREAEEIQRNSGRGIVEVLVDMGRVSRTAMLQTLSEVLKVSYAEELSADMLDQEALELLSPQQCRDLMVLPLGYNGSNTLCVAMSDPTDRSKADDVRFITGMQIEPVLVTSDLLESVMNEVFPETSHIKERIRQLDANLDVQQHSDADAESAHQLSDLADQAPVISLVNLTLKQAILSRASDIHLEPKERQMRVRFRIDGVLVEQEPVSRAYIAAVTARIKVLSRLDITERRIPQDGSFTVSLDGRRVDFRVSTFPSVTGEKTVLRILDASATKLSFADLGFPERVGKGVAEIMRMHEGVFLVTGPTGSGKSTTLYTLLSEMDSPDINIVTLEDPVEYQLESITQGQANPKAGFTFASGLRAILRQDPDVVLVGEMRDLETARIGVQASLTGHLVFSTLHTNTACEAILRLSDMGVEPFLLSSAVRGALAQRLVRRLCKECREPVVPTPAIREQFERAEMPLEKDRPIFHARGCKACSGIGYKGRAGIYELFRMTEEAQRLVVREADTNQLIEVARQDGYRTLREDGLRKVQDGLTSLEEVYRVT